MSIFNWELVHNGQTPPPGESVGPMQRLSWGRTAGLGAQHVGGDFAPSEHLRKGPPGCNDADFRRRSRAESGRGQECGRPDRQGDDQMIARTGTTIVGLLLAFAAGAAVGLLWAPASGERTRALGYHSHDRCAANRCTMEHP